MLCMIAMLGCNCIGDPGVVTVRVTNRTDSPVKAFIPMGGRTSSVAVIEPGTSGRVTFLAGPSSGWLLATPVRIEAIDSDGATVFCRTFPILDLERMQWKVEIVKGVIVCPQGDPFPPPAIYMPPIRRE